MTRLMMHSHLVQGADGKRHLDIAWESAHTSRMPSHSRSQSQPDVRHK
jgi:hypothetical protein